MAASQNNLTLLLNQQDTNGVNILNRTIGAVTYAGSVGVFQDGLAVTSGADVVFTLPTTNVLQFYLKNTHATAVLTLTATPQGGVSAIIAKIQPGAVFVNWCASTSATAGYTAIKINPDTANTTYEVFMGG